MNMEEDWRNLSKFCKLWRILGKDLTGFSEIFGEIFEVLGKYSLLKFWGKWEYYWNFSGNF